MSCAVPFVVPSSSSVLSSGRTFLNFSLQPYSLSLSISRPCDSLIQSIDGGFAMHGYCADFPLLFEGCSSLRNGSYRQTIIFTPTCILWLDLGIPSLFLRFNHRAFPTSHICWTHAYGMSWDSALVQIFLTSIRLLCPILPFPLCH